MAYMEQLERIRRWLKRIDIDTPIDDREEYEDYLWAFFQNCWHLKDWILNDPEVIDRKSIEDEINQELSEKGTLWLIQGLANRTKHFELTDTRQSESVVAAHIAVDLSDNPSTTYYHVVYDEVCRPRTGQKSLDQNG